MSRTISSHDLKALRVHQDITVIDARCKHDYDADSQKLPGAVWRNPEEIAQWSETLPKDTKVVVYCACGGSVSHTVIDYVHGRQINAHFIEGGIGAWKSAGGQIVAK